MNRAFIVVLLIIMVLGGIPAVFAQTSGQGWGQGQSLPEPVLPAAEDRGEPSGAARPVRFWMPEFSEAAYYLWNFGAVEGADYAAPGEPAGQGDYRPLYALAAAATSDAAIPRNIRNNKYFIESVRLTNLAELAYEEGDYDASSQYAAEAVRYAQLSDEYVQLQLKIKETDDAIAAARRRLDYAASVNAAARFPDEYGQAQTAYGEARSFRAAESWDEAVAAANRVLVALTAIDGGTAPLPAQYTVRPWSVSRDCLWNIAGRPWVFNDARKWKILYEANKSKMPAQDNPDLIHPGMVLDIPSIKGETRQGMWDSSRSYSPLR
jgi:nucleoid-associated protein YgaU